MSNGRGTEDFGPYLDAVNKSADRTRSVLYIVLLVLVAVLFAELNTRDGNDSQARFQLMIDALACTEAGKSPADKGCHDALKYAKARHFNFAEGGAAKPTQSVAFRAAEKRVEDLMRRELDAHLITIPVLGVAIDSNDFWIVSGPVMLFLLLILKASLERERENLNRASVYASTAQQRELLIMAQLFANPRERAPINALLLLPVPLYGYQIYTDFLTWNIQEDLHGASPFIATIEVASMLPIIWLCVRCVLAARGITHVAAKLEKAVPEQLAG